MDIRMIALDLDGTLLRTDKSLSERNRRALEAAAARGVHIVPATGRVRSMLPAEVASIPGVRYAVTANGGAVYDLPSGSQIFLDAIPAPRARQLLGLFEQYEIPVEIYVDGQSFIWSDCLEHPQKYHVSADYLAFFLSSRTGVPDFRAFALRHLDRIEKINLMFLPPELRRHLREECGKLQVDVTSSISHNLEINAAGVSKGSGLRQLCARLGVPPSAVMAAGDSDNDIAMFDFAGFSVAMENHFEGLQNHADFITLHNDEDGVAYAIERFVLS